MLLTTILFYLMAILTLAGATVMVFSKNIVHSAFALMFSLIGIAALYVLLYADFVAATQLLVYVGGILILILFGVMLTSQESTKLNFKTVTVNLIPASIVSVGLSILLISSLVRTNWPHTDMAADETVRDLGMLLMTDYLLPFIIAGVLLLIAIIGAIYMATRLTLASKKDH